ncbi:MAG: hypothetical protein U0798_19560 [Gemmataceae bacterium]
MIIATGSKPLPSLATAARRVLPLFGCQIRRCSSQLLPRDILNRITSKTFSLALDMLLLV